MTRTAWSGRPLAATIVGGVGLVLGAAGVAVTHYVPRWVEEEHAALTALPSPDARAIATTPSGTEVLVEGRIAADQPRRFRDFVTYVKEEEERDRAQRERGRRWKVVARETPPLTVATDAGSFRVVNTTYDVGPVATRWTDPSRVIATAYEGLVANETVFVHGRIAAGGVEAVRIGSGTRASFLADTAGNADVAWWLGLAFQIVGGVLLLVTLAIALWPRRRAGGDLQETGDT